MEQVIATEAEAVDYLMEAVDAAARDGDAPHVQMRTFSDAMLLTRDEGFLLTFEDSSEYQISVRRSR